jgi:hypothetical protein
MAIAQERSSGSPAFSIAPFASYNIYSESFSMHSAMSYGGAITMSLTSRIGMEFNAQFGQSQQDFDVIGGTAFLGISTSAYQLQFQYLIFSLHKSLDVLGTAGIGMVRFTTDAHTVSLGALGEVIVPGRSETRSQYIIGVIFSTHVGPRISIRLGPAVRFITPLSPLQASYTISGGLAIGMF